MQKAIRRFLSLMLSLSICPAMAAPAAMAAGSAPVFADTAGHWAQNDIEYLYHAGLVSGVSEDMFAPDAVIDKAQFVTMLVLALGLEQDIYSVGYADVSPLDDWFAGYLGAAVNAGIIENSVFAFAPEASVSRETAARMLFKAVEYEGMDKAVPDKEIVYTDITADNIELAQAASTLSLLGVMVGKSGESFVPDATLTRAEAAAVVKRLSLAASSVGEIVLPMEVSDANGATVENGVIYFGGDLSYVALDNIDFHYGLNQLKLSASATGQDMQIEAWIDSMDTVSGIKLGTVQLTAAGAAFSEQSALIDRTYGTHRLYLRLIGAGSASVESVALRTDELALNLARYSSMYKFKKSGGEITNLQYGGYLNYNALNLGEGYDTVEFTMKNTTAGQLFEMWLDNDKIGIVETLASGEEGVTVSAPVVKAENTKSLSIKPIMDVDGSISAIRFYNKTAKADLCLRAEAADTGLAVSASGDYDGGSETEAMRDGDVVKFSNVNLSDGYNVLSMRMKDSGGVRNAAVSLVADGAETGYLMGMFSQDDDAYIEVRLDSEDGMVVGKIKKNPIETGALYDYQACYIYGAKGLHDLYLKAVGDIGWNLHYIKLQERGWYDAPMGTLEAEDMDVHLGAVTDPNDITRYSLHTLEAEASGKAAVKIEQSGGYVEFTVPEWYSAESDRTAITVRHSIPDLIDESNNSIGRDGAMKVLVNGEETKILDSFSGFRAMNGLTLSSKLTRGYGKTWGNSQQGIKGNEYSGFYFNDAYGIIEGEVKPGDVIRLVPEIDSQVNYCYIDCVDIEAIPEAKEKPAGYLSVADCGATANDGADDGEALRKAVQMVKEDPYTYTGLWIPEGQFDIKSYTGGRAATAADFSGIRVLGAGMWYSRLRNHLGTYTQWNANYNTGENTVIRDLAMHGSTISRGWEENGMTLGSIAIDGSGANFFENVWLEHWNAGIWLKDGAGIYYKLRIKNTWADGINIHDNGYGIVYAKNFFRATGDDSLAIFSDCTNASNMTREAQIRNNTITGTWWASGITIWGGEDINITNNLVRDTSVQSGIGLKSWGWNTPATDRVWIRNNRVERCGNINEGNQYNGAFEIVPGYHSDDYNSIYRNTYFENNDCIDNPSLFMRISSQGGADEVFLSFRYNYIRNTCLAFPDKRTVIDYRTPDVRGRTDFLYNVLEGAFNRFKTSNTTQMSETMTGNTPDNWKRTDGER